MKTIEETYRERLQMLIAEYKTQAALAKVADIAPSQISQWVNASPSFETGKPRALSSETARKLEKATGKPTGWMDQPVNTSKDEVTILGAPRTWSSRDPLPEDEYIYAPFYKDIAFIGGNGREADEDHNDFKLPFARATLHKKHIQPNHVVCVTADGNSMEPVIAEGATLGVDKGDTTIKDGKIYIFEHGGLLRYKRLYKLPHNQVRLASYNPEYPDETVDMSGIIIYGRVFWWSVMD